MLLRQQLSEGIPLGEHLIDIVKLRIHFQFFLQYCEVASALRQSIAIYEYEKTLKEQFFQAIGYPLFIFVLSMSCLSIMVLYVLPMMIQLMEAMALQAHRTLQVVSACLSAFLGNGLILTITAACLSGYYASGNRGYQFFFWCNRKFDEHPLKFFHSLVFAGYWLACKGQSTMDAIRFLRCMTHRQLTMECAMRIDQALLAGMDLPAAIRSCDMLSNSLCICFEIGSRTQRLEDYLLSFITKTKQQIDRYQKRLIRVMQVISYGSVGIIVLIMSQVLFAPLDLLSQL